jgi:hypothetical protein
MNPNPTLDRPRVELDPSRDVTCDLRAKMFQSLSYSWAAEIRVFLISYIERLTCSKDSSRPCNESLSLYWIKVLNLTMHVWYKVLEHCSWEDRFKPHHSESEKQQTWLLRVTCPDLETATKSTLQHYFSKRYHGSYITRVAFKASASFLLSPWQSCSLSGITAMTRFMKKTSAGGEHSFVFKDEQISLNLSWHRKCM